MKYAYDYQNMHTRGWVRGGFGDRGTSAIPVSDRESAANALESIAGFWANGTNLRLVEIADDGTETFPPVTAKGSRGPLPKDKKTS